MFAMLVTTLVLGGALHYFEPETFANAFESMWPAIVKTRPIWPASNRG